VGDPGLAGRDGDLGIEVLGSADHNILLMEFTSSAMVVCEVLSIPHRLIKGHKVSVENLDKVDQR